MLILDQKEQCVWHWIMVMKLACRIDWMKKPHFDQVSVFVCVCVQQNCQQALGCYKLVDFSSRWAFWLLLDKCNMMSKPGTCMLDSGLNHAVVCIIVWFFPSIPLMNIARVFVFFFVQKRKCCEYLREDSTRNVQIKVYMYILHKTF